jgi:hypothetical protein
MQEAGVSGFNVWKTNSPLLAFAPAPAPVLAEGGKGMPPGWVSQWGDKKVQKQTDGDWAYVPHDTPLGMQPYHKGSGETVKLTPDEEMHGYLKSINFDDPAQQKTLTNSPKFVGDMLKKFGAGWYDKFKKGGAKAPDAPAPTVAPAEPTGTPVELTLKKLNISPTSKEASAVELLHKLGSLDKAANAYSKMHGLKFAPAFYALEELVKKGAGKGVWNTSGDFESDVKVTFNLGTGPVISAPAIGATTSAPSLGIKPELPKPVKAKKPKASDSTPVPPSEPLPSLPGVDTPTNPQVIALAAKLGYATNADMAKVLSIWRKHLKKNHTTANDATAVELLGLTPGVPVGGGAMQKPSLASLKTFVNDLAKKVFATPGWDAADFNVDPAPPAPLPIAVGTPVPGLPGSKAPPEPLPVAPTPPPEVPSLALDKAVADLVGKLGYKMGSAGAVAVGMLSAHDGDLDAAGKGLAAALGMKEGPASKVVKFVQDKINAMKSGTAQPEAPLAVAQIIGDTPIHAGEPETKKAGPTSLPTIPSMATLSFAGDAKAKLGGNKPKKFLKDDEGNLFLHKYGADQLRAAGGETASNISAILAPGSYVPVKAVEYEGDWGTVQPVVPNLEKAGLPEDPTKLSKDEIKQLQRERLIDWAVSNHDSKLGNFIATKDGQVFGIDKEQAFKFIGTDKLDLDYSPNPSQPIYNALYKAYAAKQIDLNPNDMLPYLQAAEKATDEEWTAAVKPYLSALSASEVKAKLAAILARKHSLRKDFETFFTELRKKRGEDAFTFPSPPAETTPAPVPAPAPAPAGTGTLVKPEVPDISSLTYEGPATIGGAGEKHFYKDSEGKKWLLKVAAGKGTGKNEPWKVAAQTLFAMVGAAVKPVTPPVGATTFKGKPATLQPWLGDNLKTLSGVPPQKLSTVEKMDVASEHVLDWLTSQHDTHGGNLVKLPDTGAIVGIDKEQGFKYLMPSLKWKHSTPEGDKLSTDYHPNAQYGESEPYYNTFWKGFENGDFNFDPASIKGTIDAVEKIDDATYTAGLVGYAQAVWPEDAAQAAKFYEKAFARKKNIRKEFEAFITDLYKKRTKKEGLFTFNTGWVPEGATAPAPVGVPSVPAPPPPEPKKPASAPHPDPVPLPTGFVAPPDSAFAKAAAQFEFGKGSVYYPALKQLQLYNNNVSDSAKQLSYLKNLPLDVAMKRVKHALKVLKGVDGGWSAFSGAAGPTGYSAATATNPPSTSGEGAPSTLFFPGKAGELGNSNVKLVTPTEAFKPPPPPPLPPVPPGFEPPPVGKMWEVSPASTFFTSSGKLYKTKPPKKPDGTPDTESPNLVAKFNATSVSAVEQALKQVEVAPVVPLKEKAPYVIGVFAKEEWAKAQASTKKLGVLVDLPPPPPPPSGKFTTAPQAGSLKNALSTRGMAELANVQDEKIGFGMGFRLGGTAVEHHAFSVQRRLDPDGKPYYRFMFKLREPYWKKLKGFDEGSFDAKTASYNEKEDAFKELSKTEHTFSVRRWKAADSVAALATNGDSESYALKGYVIADVRPEGDQTPLEGLKKLLKTMGPGVADEVLHDPTVEEQKLLGLSALLWSVAPQEADGLTETQRNVDHLTTRLKALGYSQEQMDSVRFERVGIDQTVPVLPGRGKALQAKHKLGYVSFCCSSPERVMLQLQGGSVGIVQRLKHGFTITQKTTSGHSDLASGGGDYVFTWPGHQNASGWENHWGQIEMVYDPSEYDRLDCFMHTGDSYGRTNGSVYDNRKTLESHAGSAAEICFRQGLNANKLVKIRCQSADMVPTLIKAMKDQGITKVNGMTPEELVVSGTGSGETFYKTFLAPGGY